MKRLFIIEGPDGAGKTTLARQLCRDFKADYHHEGPPPRGVSLLHHYGSQLASAYKPTVFDRFHVGELVYGPILRGQSGLSNQDMVLMQRLVNGRGATVIICLPPLEVTVQNLHKKELLDQMQLKLAYDHWTRLTAPGHPFVTYDYTTQEKLLPRILAEPYRLHWDAIGAPGARFLFVGERVNGDLDVPFFSTQSSSAFLNDALAAAGYQEHEIAFTNAFDKEGHARDLIGILEPLSPDYHVIALGEHAKNLCAATFENPMRWSSVPHPSFWRRFRYRRSEEYVELLREVRNGVPA